MPSANPAKFVPSGNANSARSPNLLSTSVNLQISEPNDSTRIVICNGRESTCITDTPGIKLKRSHTLPVRVIEHVSRQPLTSALFTYHLAFVPSISKQRVHRPQGEWSYMLLYCLSGSGKVATEGTSFKMSAGDVVLFKPFQAHGYEPDQTDPWSYYCVHFHGLMAPIYAETIEAANRRGPTPSASNLCFVEVFERLLAIYAEGYSQKNLTLASVATHQLLGEVFSLVQNESASQAGIEDRIDRTLEVINRNLAMQVSIPELAVHANMSRSYFVSQFRKRTGTSPRNYINRLRIAHACKRLQDGDEKIESIALSLGFCDSFYFCRVFKQIAGCTPTEHRHSPTRLKHLVGDLSAPSVFACNRSEPKAPQAAHAG